MLTGVVFAGVCQVCAMFPCVPPGAYTGEILLNVQAYPPVFTWIIKALVLLVANCSNPAFRARTEKRGTVQSSAVGSVLARAE